MATLKEFNYWVAIAQAQAVRQTAYAAALTAYGFVAANYATYVTALVTADAAYKTALVTAANAQGISPNYDGGGAPVGASFSATILT